MKTPSSFDKAVSFECLTITWGCHCVLQSFAGTTQQHFQNFPTDCQAYRVEESVDISAMGSQDAYNVGWTRPGEFLRYTVNVDEAGEVSYSLFSVFSSREWFQHIAPVSAIAGNLMPSENLGKGECAVNRPNGGGGKTKLNCLQ